MTRRLLLAAVAALAAAAPAAASLPLIPSGSSVGDGVPFKAYASLTPPVHLFGDPVTATIAVVADTKWVDPARLRVTASFRPYQPIEAPTVLRLQHRPLRADHVDVDAALPERAVRAAFPAERQRARLPLPARARELRRARRQDVVRAHDAVAAGRGDLADRPGGARRHRATGWDCRGARTSRRSPRRRTASGRASLYWLSLSLAAVLGCAALLLAGRWGLAMRPQRASGPTLSASATPLERALVLLAWARQHDDETLQRKALERVADELGTEVAGIDELTEKARELAWSSRGPESEEVDSFSKQAHEAVEEESV